MARTPLTRARRRSRAATAGAASVAAAATAVLAAGAFAPEAAAVPAPAAAPAAAPAQYAARAEPAAGSVEVTPTRVAPGAEVRVRAGLCGSERTAVASSVAFEGDIDLRRTGDGTAFHGSAPISADAVPGTYSLTVVCGLDAREGEGSFKVLPAADGTYAAPLDTADDPGTPADPGASEEQGAPQERGYHPGQGDHPDQGERPDGPPQDGRPDAQHPDRDTHHEPPPEYASPVAPVRAGGGGTAGDLAGDGDGTAQRVGLTLAGGAAVAGAAAWAVRRRRSGAHTAG